MTTTIPMLIIETNNQPLFSAVVCTDGTEKECTIMSIGGALDSLGEYAGRVIRSIRCQGDVGSILSTLKIYSPTGGVVASFVGNERTQEQTYNLNATGLNIPIVKGMTIKANTAD